MLRSLAADIFELGMLTLGVSLLGIWINHVRAAGGLARDPMQPGAAEGDEAPQTGAGSVDRNNPKAAADLITR